MLNPAGSSVACSAAYSGSRRVAEFHLQCLRHNSVVFAHDLSFQGASSRLAVRTSPHGLRIPGQLDIAVGLSGRSVQFSPPQRIAGQVCVRTFAKISFQRHGRLKFYIDSPGSVMKHYIPPPSWLSLVGPIQLWQAIHNWAATLFSLRRIRAVVGLKEYTAFKANLANLFSTINKAIAEADLYTLREHMTESAYATVKAEIATNKRSKDLQYLWKLHSLDPPPRVLSLRDMVIRELNNSEYIQACVHYKSTQSFEVRDKEGKLVAGSPSPKPVEEYWVFERKLVKNAPWRFVAKIKPEDD